MRGFRVGSSPHTRGAPVKSEVRSSGARIIPAYAGSTPIAAKPDNLVMGSSPHTRGAPRSLSPSPVGSRIIPAYAGSTSTPAPPTVSPRDHPRIRGEHAALASQAHSIAGSSPHTRGAPVRRHPAGGAQRIIPAYAGSTRAPSCGAVSKRDHPRIRGEHSPQRLQAHEIGGSSPHTRGAQLRVCLVIEVPRIIPAYAGSTMAVTGSLARMRDHPRIRGEHTWKSLQYQGSPS